MKPRHRSLLSGHLLMENRNALIVDAELTCAPGTPAGTARRCSVAPEDQRRTNVGADRATTPLLRRESATWASPARRPAQQGRAPRSTGAPPATRPPDLARIAHGSGTLRMMRPSPEATSSDPRPRSQPAWFKMTAAVYNVVRITPSSARSEPRRRRNAGHRPGPSQTPAAECPQRPTDPEPPPHQTTITARPLRPQEAEIPHPARRWWARRPDTGPCRDRAGASVACASHPRSAGPAMTHLGAAAVRPQPVLARSVVDRPIGRGTKSMQTAEASRTQPTGHEVVTRRSWGSDRQTSRPAVPPEGSDRRA